MKTVNIISVLVISFTLASLGCSKGEAGPQGAPGASGAGKITSTMNCSGVVTGLSGGAAALNGLTIDYNAVLTSGGDVYATANVVDSSLQVSGTAFYAAGEIGSTTAEVLITNDYYGSLNGGYWSVSLNRSNMVTSIVYTDTSLGGQSPVNMTFTSSACTVANF